MNIQSRYSRQYADPGISFVDSESLTQQHFKEECDIRNIVSGLKQPTSILTLEYGDFSSRAASDYQSALNKIKQAEDAFNTLPSTIRKRFNHSPKDFLKFVGDEANYDEGVKLGIFKPRTAVAQSEEATPVTDGAATNATD